MDKEKKQAPQKQDKNNNNGSSNIKNSVTILLIVIMLAFGVNRFVFSRSPRGVGAANNSLSQIGLEYYIDNYGDQNGSEGLKAVVRNFGCHQEIYIYKDDELVMRLSYSRGRIYEL